MHPNPKRTDECFHSSCLEAPWSRRVKFIFPSRKMVEEEVRVLVEERYKRAKRIVGRWISLESRKKMMKVKPVVSLNRSGVGNTSVNARPVRFTDSVLAGHQMRKAMLKSSSAAVCAKNNSSHISKSDSEDSEEERLLRSKRRK